MFFLSIYKCDKKIVKECLTCWMYLEDAMVQTRSSFDGGCNDSESRWDWGGERDERGSFLYWNRRQRTWETSKDGNVIDNYVRKLEPR